MSIKIKSYVAVLLLCSPILFAKDNPQKDGFRDYNQAPQHVILKIRFITPN